MRCEDCGAPIENGKCTNCGRRYNLDTNPIPEEGQKEEKKAKVPDYKRPKERPIDIVVPKKRKSGCLIIVIILVVLGIIGMIFGDDSSDESKSVWKEGYSELEEFDYYIDGDEIYLKDYNGSSSKVRISSTYTVDGKECRVVALTEGTFALGSVKSAIIPEGVVSVEMNTFNSCGIKNVFLPSTLKEISSSFLGYFHDVDTIYYGGSEEQWNSLVEKERGDIDAKQIKFDINPDDLQ